MKQHLDGGPRIVQTITSIRDSLVRSLDYVRVHPRLRELLPTLPPGEVADALERHIAELSRVSLARELLRSVPSFEPAARDAFAQALVAPMLETGTKRLEVARLIGMSPDSPLKNISSDRLNRLITHLAASADLLASSTIAFLHERPSALLQMTPTFGAGVLDRVQGGPPVSPFDEPPARRGSPLARQPAMLRARAAIGAAAFALVVMFWYASGHMAKAPPPSAASLPLIAPIAVVLSAPHHAVKEAPLHHALSARPPAPKGPSAVAHPLRARHPIAKHRAPKFHKQARASVKTPRSVRAATAPKAVALAAGQTMASVPQEPAPQSASVPAVPLQMSIETDGSTAAQSASSFVGDYLRSLMSGDEASAYADLGGVSGDRGLVLSEEQFIDARTRIISMHAKQIGHGSASVAVELQSPKGLYYATYQIDQGAKGLVIASHDFIKP